MITLAEIQAAFPGLTAANRDDGAIATALSVGRTKSEPVQRALFAMWAGQTGMRASIQDASATAGHPLRSVALTLLDFLQGGVSPSLDLSLPANQAMLSAWQAAGAITAQQIADLNALGIVPDVVTTQDVAKALEGVF